MILRYANDLHEKLISKLETHRRVITSMGYLTGEYRSFKVRFSKLAGADSPWTFTDHKHAVGFAVASGDSEVNKAGTVKEGEFYTVEIARYDVPNANGRVYVAPKNMSICPGVSKDDLYNMMVSYVMNLLATTKGIDTVQNLVVCFIWSENGGCLFIDNFREGVDNLGYEIHPYVRAGWDAELVSLIPDGCMYEDESTRTWMHHFHNHMRMLQINYDLSYSDVENTWYARLSSAAPDECFLSRDRASVASAAEDCLRHIGRLGVFDVLEQVGWTTVNGYQKAV